MADLRVLSKNWFRNGGFWFWNRGISFTGTSEWLADHWRREAGGTVTRASGRPTGLGTTTYAIQWVQASTTVDLRHYISGENALQFTDRHVTISFWAKLDSGTRQSPFTVTISSLANTTTRTASSETLSKVLQRSLTSGWRLFEVTFQIPETWVNLPNGLEIKIVKASSTDTVTFTEFMFNLGIRAELFNFAAGSYEEETILNGGINDDDRFGSSFYLRDLSDKNFILNSVFENWHTQLIPGGYSFFPSGRNICRVFNTTTPTYGATKWFSSQFGDTVTTEYTAYLVPSRSERPYPAISIAQAISTVGTSLDGLTFNGGTSRLCTILTEEEVAPFRGSVVTLKFVHRKGSYRILAATGASITEEYVTKDNSLAYTGAWEVFVRGNTSTNFTSAECTEAAAETRGDGLASSVFRTAGLSTTTWSEFSISFYVPVGTKSLMVVFKATNSASNNKACLNLSEVTLYKGTINQPFKLRTESMGAETLECSRYYWGAEFSYWHSASTSRSFVLHFPTIPAKESPTFTTTLYGGSSNILSVGRDGSTSRTLNNQFLVVTGSSPGEVWAEGVMERNCEP